MYTISCIKLLLTIITCFKALWYSCILAPSCNGATSLPIICILWLYLWHHNGCLHWCHCGIVMHHISWVGKSHLHLENNMLYINYRLVIFKTTGWWYLTVIEFVFWILLCLLIFSILLISASNIRFEARIHQLNENVDSISGFEMFPSLCCDFKVTFLLYLGWIVNSAISVYLKFYIFQNGTTNIYERSHFRPNFATYKCMSMPPSHLKYNHNINAKCSIFQ